MQKTGEYRQAIAYYFTALKNDPSCEDAMYGLGECYIKLDDHSNAYDFFLKVRSLHGGMQRNAEVYIGLCLFKLGKYSEAAEYLETGLKGISEKLPLWNEGMAKLADSYIFCRDIGKVREIYQKILANHPSNSEIRHKETILTNFFNNKELIDFYNLDGDKFQQTVKKIFERLDFIIDSMGINSENSISLKISRIRKSSQRVTEFIFLDRTPRLVTVTVLEEEFEKMKASRAQIAFFITLFDFEDGCHQYVASKPLELINGAEFYKILKGYDPF
ncbi:MAG TPA: hypothetical protein DC049_05760 [Spirochaetia bacterium]|nr:hypothetical protein [Spirochaetia bacterium]